MSADEILKGVADHLEVSVSALKAGRRTPDYVDAKYIAIKIMTIAGITQKDIIEAMNCDRTGIYYALSKHDDWMKVDKYYRAKYTECFGRVYGKVEA